MAIEDSIMACKPEERQDKAHLIAYNSLISPIITNQPNRTDKRPNIRQNTLEIPANGCRYQRVESPMLMDLDCAIVGLRERFVMVGSEYICFVALANHAEAEINDELFCAADA